MSDHPAARASNNADAHRGLRLLALIAVAIGVILLAAAAFALSYDGIHTIALQAGVPARLARLYPLIFDAMLVVGGAAVLSLRGAGLVTRCYAWLTVLILLAAAAWADALDATATRLPQRSAAATVAIIPWVLALIGFGLLLAMLRHARLRRAAAPVPQIAAPVPVHVSAIVVPSAPVRSEVYRDADEDPIRYGDTDLAVDADAGQDDPTSDEARAIGLSAAPWVPRPREEAAADHVEAYPAGTMSAAPTPDPGPDPDQDPGPDPDQDPGHEPNPDRGADPAPPAMPAFDRMQSSPTPPGD